MLFIKSSILISVWRLKLSAKILEFEEFQQITMVVDENKNATYQGKPLKSEKGNVVIDKPMKKGAKIH